MDGWNCGYVLFLSGIEWKRLEFYRVFVWNGVRRAGNRIFLVVVFISFVFLQLLQCLLFCLVWNVAFALLCSFCSCYRQSRKE